MIEMPRFNDEKWYLEQIKNCIADGRIKKNNKRKEAYCQNVSSIEKTLKQVLEDSDFSDNRSDIYLFEKLVLAPYSDLCKIYDKIETNAEQIFFTTKMEKGKEKKIMKPEWKHIYEIYDKIVSKGINTQLVQKYNIKCCPYCNENFIFNRKKNNSGYLSVAQLDHFYPRSKYPIFAISLYNIVPICGACNHIKGDKEIGISPHDHSVDYSKMKISYIPKNAEYINKTDDIEVVFKFDDSDYEFKTRMKNNLENMGIEKSYNVHIDYVQEIIKKAQIYGDGLRDNILKDFPDLFESDEELVRTIFGNYIEMDDLLKRPLSKMTHDLLKELEII